MLNLELCVEYQTQDCLPPCHSCIHRLIRRTVISGQDTKYQSVEFEPNRLLGRVSTEPVTNFRTIPVRISYVEAKKGRS